MNYLIYSIILLSLVTLGVVSANIQTDISVVNPSIDSGQAVPTAIPAWTMLEKIRVGVDLLNSSPPLVYENKVIIAKSGKKIQTNEVLRKQIGFAILNTANGAVFEKRMWVKEADITNYPKTRVVRLEPVDPRENLDIQPRYWNSFNTFYEISGHAEMIVVANKYLLASKYLEGLPEKSKDKFSQIIYAPYSPALNRPETVEAGREYIKQKVDAAFATLEKNQVMSRSASGKLVTAAINKDFVKNIMLVEHIDPDLFSVAPDGGRELAERVLTIIGTNKDRAYRYTGSPAGANGLAQFIRPTYKTVVANYPQAALIKDYYLGMADHTNAIQAMVLFFDAYSNEITHKVSKKEVVRQLGITEEMLAAAYNGGPNRVVSSVNKFGLAWISDQFVLPKIKRIFRTETLTYIRKFQSIKELDFF